VADTELRIVADTFERDGGVVEAPFDQRIFVVLRRLDIADYELGNGVLVERETRSESAVDSAMWLRLLALRTAGERSPRDRPVYAQRLKPPASWPQRRCSRPFSESPSLGA